MVIFAVVALAYIVRTWRHPRLRVAIAFSTIGLVCTVLLIPWGAWLATQVGEQWQPIGAAQLAIASVPLIAPFQWVAYLLLATFTLELILIVLYQQHLGLVPFPSSEPFVSLCISALALAVLLLRKQRQRIGLAIIRARAEGAAIARLSPLIESIRRELDRTIDALMTISTASDTQGRALSRSIARLRALREQLEVLSAQSPDVTDQERQLLARDSHGGTMIFALAGIAVATLGAWGTRGLPLGLTPTLLPCLALGFAAIALWLWMTRRHPTIRRSVIASVLLLTSGSLMTAYIHIYWVQMPQPVFPSTGQKMLLMVPVLLRLPSLWIGALMVILTAVSHVIIQIAVAGDRPVLEPWHTLLFALVGLGYLVMGEQRRIASIALLRAEAEASSFYRHANLSLALCDQLNTPLQTVMSLVSTLPPDASTAAATTHIDRLRDSSKELSRLVGQIPPELHRSSLNGARELEPRFSSSKEVRTRT